MASKISVVTVSLNQGEFIKQNIESVLAQNYPNFEHIIIDGGSTDGTLNILRSYPHLKWTSEPDRCQSEALNKGFSRANGEIIAWLNSDDWYAPNTFESIASALTDYPVVLSSAEETDRSGKWKQTVPNVERSFYDLLRYWIPYAWVAQNGVFFLRSLLEEVKYRPGYYVEEDLNFCMDYDLWLRMAGKYPFKKRIPKTCGFFRVYDENKTGRSPLAVQKEFGRVFRRHLNRLCRTERPLTFILPVGRLSADLTATINGLLKQSLHNFDLLFVDYCQMKEESEAVQVSVSEIEKLINVVGVRYLKSKTLDPLRSVNFAVEHSNSPLLAVVWPGDVVAANFSAEAFSCFGVDPAGLALPLQGIPSLQERLHNPQTYKLRFESLFDDIALPMSFVFRREAFLELGGFRTWQTPAHAMRELVLRVLWKGWHVSSKNELQLQSISALFEANQAAFVRNRDYICAKLVSDLQDEFGSDPFAKVRAEHGWMPILNPEIVARSKTLVGTRGPAGLQ
jgi:hypothetical protein